MDSTKSRAYCGFTTGMDVMLSSYCCLHIASVYPLNVFRMIRCLGLVFGGMGGEWRAQGKGIFSRSGLAIFRTETGREQIALLSSNHFTSVFFQQCNQASSCFGAGTQAFSRAESYHWVWRDTFFFLFEKSPTFTKSRHLN